MTHMSQRILIVEDHEPSRRFIRALLASRTETQTFEVSDGPAAIEKAEALQPDVILLDISLPGLHGLEVARQLPRIAPPSRVLFVSQELDPDVIHETLRLGGRGYVHKLRCDEDLMPAIDAVLEGRRFVSSILESTHPRSHKVLFCSDDAALIDGFSRFAGASIRAGHAAIVLATEPHRNGVLRTLRETEVDIDAGIERGTCLLLDAAATLETIMVDGAPDHLRFLEGLRGLICAASKATGLEYPRVAICGECVGLLCANGDLDAAITIEKIGNDLVKAYDVDILCAYPLPRWRDDDLFRRVCAQHSAVRYV
jgi:CheY-like chemotaxis protein